METIFNNIEIEKAILGALMVDKPAQEDILLHCDYKLFYESVHQEIFKNAVKLNKEKKDIDMITMLTAMRNNPYLESSGGAYYISTLTTMVSSATNTDTHIRILKELFIKRTLIAYFQKGIQDVSLNLDIFDVFNDFTVKLENLFKLKENNVYDMYDVITKRLDEIDNIDSSLSLGLKTGIDEIDNNIGGWQKTDLIIIAGKTSMGKTAMSLYFAKSAALNKNNILFFSLEMSKQQLADRLISLQTGINSKKLKTNNLNSHDWDMIGTEIPIYDNTNFKVIDDGGLTIEQIASHSKIENKKHPIDLIVVDYMQLIKKSTNGNTNDQVAHISSSLKALAKKINCPVIALSQLKRNTNEKPKLSDLRDSGAIEQDADIVMFVHRYDYEDNPHEPEQENLIELIFSKHRNGEIGTVEIYRNADWSNFSSKEQFKIPIF